MLVDHLDEEQIRGLRNSLGCFSHVKNIDLHYITNLVSSQNGRLISFLQVMGANQFQALAL